MSKAHRDPRSQLPSLVDPDDGADPASDREPSASPMMDPRLHAGTAPDEVPAVHVLQAAHDQDRKEAQELLSGFNRRGRGPQRPNADRDFVDYYAKKTSTDRGLGPVLRPEEIFVPRQIDLGTRVKPREDERPSRFPAWLGWAGAGLAMLLVGGLVAFLAILATDDEPTGKASATAAAASLGPASVAPPPRDFIPPPSPAVETAPEAVVTATAITTTPVTVEPAPHAARRERGPASSSTAAAAAVTTTGAATNVAREPTAVPAPARTSTRDDFIRDL